MRESERWSKMIADLTRERDEAVRERDELRAKAVMADRISAQITRDAEASGGIPWAWYMRWRTDYDSLTTDKAAQGRTGKETA